MMLEGLIPSLILILISELGDKTMVMSVVFSARYGKSVLILLAILSALIAVTLIGIGTGIIIFEVIPQYVFKYISSGLFLILGVYYLIKKETDDSEHTNPDIKSTLTSIFAFIFISEFGDKTQLAVISLTITTLDPLGVLLGAIAGFAVINTIAVILGNIISEKISIRLFQKISAVVFIVFGILILLGVL
ncbi:MAG: TMEM165/GDT1 family protein [Candidatus Odinarchaeia archaeon]